jgi:hypothetical protein
VRAACVFLLRMKCGGGGARSAAEGAAADLQAAEALADDGFRIRSPAGDGEETAVHLEGRAGAWAAEVGGWLKMDFGVVELERLTGKELRDALRDQLVA